VNKKVQGKDSRFIPIDYMYSERMGEIALSMNHAHISRDANNHPSKFHWFGLGIVSKAAEKRREASAYPIAQ
jgi:hypothetical protein